MCWDELLAMQNGVNLTIRQMVILGGAANLKLPVICSNPPANADWASTSLMVKELAIFRCPSDPENDSVDFAGWATAIKRSYVINMGEDNFGTGFGLKRTAIKTSTVQSSAGTVFLGESYKTSSNVFGRISDEATWEAECSMNIPDKAYILAWFRNYNGGNGSNPIPVHGAINEPRFNVLMHDGHVELCDKTTTTTNINTSGILRYNKL
jgi:prepilin-type processing-associated H-X9-DG protein